MDVKMGRKASAILSQIFDYFIELLCAIQNFNIECSYDSCYFFSVTVNDEIELSVFICSNHNDKLITGTQAFHFGSWL